MEWRQRGRGNSEYSGYQSNHRNWLFLSFVTVSPPRCYFLLSFRPSLTLSGSVSACAGVNLPQYCGNQRKGERKKSFSGQVAAFSDITSARTNT